jgi:putative Holliday junction resolvase
MILGVDYGARRVGVAAADSVTRFARPVEVIDSIETDPVERIAQLVRELNATTVVVGRPVGLSGSSGSAVAAQQQFVSRLRVATTAEVTEHDERYTTVVAEQGLRASGARAGARRNARDAVAAQLMLQGYLDARGMTTE